MAAMKTDHPIYLFLSTGAEAFRVLTGGQRLAGAYCFGSHTCKGLERRIDGVFESDGHAGPVYVIEFQGQAAPAVWYNLLTKIGLYGERYPQRDVVGIGIFLRARDLPAYPSRISDQLAVALDAVLPDWLEREPDNPYLAVFAPLVIDDEAELRQRAAAYWRTVQEAPVSATTRDTLSMVMEFWFFERFRGWSAKEIWNMLNIVTPIQETRAYQSIFIEGKAEGEAKGRAEGEAKGRAEGEAKGKAEGEAKGRAEGETKGKAGSLKRLLTRRFGPLPAWAEQRIEMAPMAQLDEWLDGLFDAPGLTDLLGPESATPES
jgi:predicted transposase YdaD